MNLVWLFVAQACLFHCLLVALITRASCLQFVVLGTTLAPCQFSLITGSGSAWGLGATVGRSHWASSSILKPIQNTCVWSHQALSVQVASLVWDFQFPIIHVIKYRHLEIDISVKVWDYCDASASQGTYNASSIISRGCIGSFRKLL